MVKEMEKEKNIILMVYLIFEGEYLKEKKREKELNMLMMAILKEYFNCELIFEGEYLNEIKKKRIWVY